MPSPPAALAARLAPSRHCTALHSPAGTTRYRCEAVDLHETEAVDQRGEIGPRRQANRRFGQSVGVRKQAAGGGICKLRQGSMARYFRHPARRRAGEGGLEAAQQAGVAIAKFGALAHPRAAVALEQDQATP